MARDAWLAGGRSKASRPHAADESGDLLAGNAFDREALALAQRSAGIGVWSIDLTTGLVRGTAQFYRIMGLEPTRDSIPVDTIRAVWHPEDRERVVAGFREALDGGGDSYEIEYRIIRPDGNLRWIFGRGRLIRDRKGTPVRCSGVDLDITDRKATEEALSAAKQELERMNQILEQRVLDRTAALEVEATRRAEAESRLHQAQKMEAVGQLTGGIAHDFNNILQVILGSLEIVTISLKRGALDEPGSERRALIERVTATAQRSALSAKALVQRLLAFSRQQPLAPTVLDVNALVGDMTELIGRALGETIDLDTTLAAELWPVYADRNQLESVLLNLVVNARDAMPQGGRLCIQTANEDLAAECPDDLVPGSYVTLSVSDTGCGIAREHLDRVFEPFFTTKDAGKGSGLGLSMVYGFVKQSGGHIRIRSEAGSGTSVKIYLPRSERNNDGSLRGRAPDARAADGSSLRARPGETVLLVDDNEAVRRVGVSALEELGYHVIEAADASSALRALDAPEGHRVDLLLTDIALLSGMSGLDLAREARTKRPQLHVLFTSDYARTATAKDEPPVPEARLLDKPYSIEKLAARCRLAIDGSLPAAGS